ncbi:transposable element Tc1 transposase [Trichonephila clavipes]|nr:transposable element Tc1 transposase [Trichonephila clavipes]
MVIPSIHQWHHDIPMVCPGHPATTCVSTHATAPRSHFLKRQGLASHNKGVTRLSTLLLPFLGLPDPQIVTNRKYLGSFRTLSWASYEFERTRGKGTANMERMSQDIIRSLYASMSDRITSCIRAKGGSTRIVGLREAGLPYRAVAARVQRNSSTLMRVLKQWMDEGRTARKSVSGPRKVTSAREDRRLVRMAQTDRTAFSRQLAAQWSTATRVSLCASSIRRRLLQRGLHARIALYRIPLTQNHRRLRLHWANVHKSWRADWQQVVFSDESRFNLWHHDGRIRVRLYAGELRILECIIERHSG